MCAVAIIFAIISFWHCLGKQHHHLCTSNTVYCCICTITPRQIHSKVVHCCICSNHYERWERFWSKKPFHAYLTFVFSFPSVVNVWRSLVGGSEVLVQGCGKGGSCAIGTSMETKISRWVQNVSQNWCCHPLLTTKFCLPAAVNVFERMGGLEVLLLEECGGVMSISTWWLRWWEEGELFLGE